MAGVEEANAGFLKLNTGAMAAGVALAGLVLLGRDAIKNAEAQATATLDLTQAIEANNSTVHAAIVTHADTTRETEALATAQRHLAEAEAGMPTKHAATALQLMHLQDAQDAVTKASDALAAKQADVTTSMAVTKLSVSDVQQQLGDFLSVNSRYIADQYDTQEALANLIRTGLNPGEEAFRALNDALDLAVIKHEAVSDAAKTITLAEAGNSKGLKDLGITTDDYNAIMKSTLSDADKHAALLALIETKTKDGKKATSDLTQQQQDLNNKWKDSSERIAPALIQAQLDIAQAIQTALDIGELEAQMFWGIATKVTQMTDSIISDIRRMVNAANAIPGVHLDLLQLLGAGGTAAQPGGPNTDGLMNAIAQRGGYTTGR